MSVSRHPVPQLSDVQLVQLLSGFEGVELVQLRFTVPALDHRSTVSALGMDPLDARIQQAYHFDTADLALERHGVTVRARRLQDNDDEVAVDLRPAGPNDVPADLLRSPGFGLVVDVTPGGYSCGASLRAVPKTDVKGAVAGVHPPLKLCSKGQRALIASRMPQAVEVDELSALGPVFGLRLRFAPPAPIRRMVADLWLYPGASAILELSVTCAPAEVVRTAGEGRALLARHGVDLSGESHLKTRRALQFFAKRLMPTRQDVPS